MALSTSACGGENETKRYINRPMSLWKKLLWIAVTLLGLGSVAILAMSRGEQINALWIIVAGVCAFAISYRFYSKWLASKVLLLNDQRHARSRAKRRQRFCADESLDGFWTSFRCHRRARPVSRTGVGGAVRIFTGHALDPDRGDPWGRRTRHDCAVRLGAAARKNARANGEGRDWARGGRTRIDQRARHHDHFARGPGAGGGAGVGKKSLGCLHHRHDHSHRLAHGRRIAQWPFQCQLDYRLRNRRAFFCRVGRTISWEFPGARSLVSA